LAVSRGSKASAAATTPRVTFEVERFGWISDDRLEITGRWSGLRGHRFLRPTLDIQVDGRHRRLLALLEHKPWAADDGDEWIAAFPWQGEPLQVDGAELALGPDLAVELPPPSGGRAAPADDGSRSSAELLAAGRPRAEIELELSTARDEGERLTRELERLRATHATRVEELQQRLGGEREAVTELKAELEAARKSAAAAEAENAERMADLSKERDAAVAASSAALAETKRIESERDAALRARAGVEQERDAAVRARDSARQERNAWMSRARTALAERSASSGGTVRRRPERPRQQSAQPAEPPAPAPESGPPPPEPAKTTPLARAEPRPTVRRVPARPAPARAAEPEPQPARTGRAKPGVRTVRIGGAGREDDLDPPSQDESASNLLGMPQGGRPRRPVPLWASQLLAVLALLAAIAVIVLLLL
jgi:hypothetical protein